MITMEELNPTGYQSDPDIMANLVMLYDKMNDVRKAYGRPMIVTSGLRTKEDQIRIYSNIFKRKGIPFDSKKIPMRSNHLFGLACDIYDPDGALKIWVMKNLDYCKKLDLYFESFRYTPNWVHFQIVPPRSGARFFVP